MIIINLLCTYNLLRANEDTNKKLHYGLTSAKKITMKWKNFFNNHLWVASDNKSLAKSIQLLSWQKKRLTNVQKQFENSKCNFPICGIMLNTC